MFDPLISGISFGLLLAVMLGPVFFTLLQTSLHEGFKAGFHLAVGVLISDMTLIGICIFFASQLNLLDEYRITMGWIGGILMISFGLFNFFRKVVVKEVDDNKKTVHAKFMLQGFLLNIINPAVLLFWLGVVSIMSVKIEYTRTHQIVFFGSLLATIFLTDVLKGYVAHRIKNLLKPKVMLWINRIIGTALVGFGVNMILKVVAS
jgi:threonine/homoserine/homoserine lactone efflux protein